MIVLKRYRFVFKIYKIILFYTLHHRFTSEDPNPCTMAGVAVVLTATRHISTLINQWHRSDFGY